MDNNTKCDCDEARLGLGLGSSSKLGSRLDLSLGLVLES